MRAIKCTWFIRVEVDSKAILSKDYEFMSYIHMKTKNYKVSFTRALTALPDLVVLRTSVAVV